jgi:hypothetical protein
MNKDLNIYWINILNEVTTNSNVRSVGEFYFQIDKKISKDKALEITTEAIEHYIDYLLEKDSWIGRDDFFSLIERGFIKLGKIYDYNTIDVATLDENVHKVRSLKDAIKEEQIWNIVPEKLDVYAIDGTPSKGYVFCKTEKFRDNSKEYKEYSFIFWDKFSKNLTHKIYLDNGEFEYILDWNYETQKKRYSDISATPENMFKMSYFYPLDEDIIKEKEYSIPHQKGIDKTTVETVSYEALYDGFRFDMEINFRPFFHLPYEKKDEIREFHKSFADRINQVLSDDIKYRFDGTFDFASLKYVPFEKIDEVWDIVKEWSVEADKLGNSLKGDEK